MLRSAVSQQVELVNTAINVKSDQLDQVLDDFTVWDDLIHYISVPDQNWAVSNIGTSLDAFKLSSILVYSMNKELVYKFGSPADVNFSDSVQKQKVLNEILRKGYLHYFYLSAQGIIEITASTVHPTLDINHTTPAKGIFILTKCWNKDFFEDLSRNTSSHVSCVSTSTDELFAIEDDSLIVYKTLLNEASAKTVVLAFKKSNKALSSFNQINNFVFGFLCLFLTIIVLSFFWVLYKWVRKPLNIISDSLRGADDSQLNLLEKSQDEFSQVAQLIRVFNQQKIDLVNENTERKLSEDQLHRQTNMLQGLTEASNKLLTGDNPDSAITNALEAIGKISHIDRIFIYQNVSDKAAGYRKIKRAFEWIAPEVREKIIRKRTNGIFLFSTASLSKVSRLCLQVS